MSFASVLAPAPSSLTRCTTASSVRSLCAGIASPKKSIPTTAVLARPSTSSPRPPLSKTSVPSPSSAPSASTSWSLCNYRDQTEIEWSTTTATFASWTLWGRASRARRPMSFSWRSCFTRGSMRKYRSRWYSTDSLSSTGLTRRRPLTLRSSLCAQKGSSCHTRCPVRCANRSSLWWATLRRWRRRRRLRRRRTNR